VILSITMIVVVKHFGSLVDMEVRGTLGLLFIGFKQNFWTFGILNFVKVCIILLVTIIGSEEGRSFACLGLVVGIMCMNHFSDQNETFDRESLGYLEWISCTALLLTAFFGLSIQFRDYEPEMGKDSDILKVLDDWKLEIANCMALLNAFVLLYGMFAVVYNHLAIKLSIANSAGARLSPLNRLILRLMRKMYGLRELTLHTTQDEICVVYDTGNDQGLELSQLIFDQFRKQLACGIQELNTIGSFDIKPTNVCFVLTPQALYRGEVREALESAIVQKKNIILIHSENLDIDSELMWAFEEKAAHTFTPGGLSKEAFKHRMQALVYRQKSVVKFLAKDMVDDGADGMKTVISKLDLVDPRVEVHQSVETINMSSLQREDERQVVHQGMKEIVQACMDGSEFFSPSLCAKAFVLAFQRAMRWRGVQLTAWEQHTKKYNRLGPFNYDMAHRSITVDEFYNAVKDVNDDLIDQHPDIVKLLVAKDDSKHDQQKESPLEQDEKAKRRKRRAQALKQQQAEEEEKFPLGHPKHMPKYSHFLNANHQEAPTVNAQAGYHCPRCMRLFTLEEAEAHSMVCTCPGSLPKTEENPEGENKLQFSGQEAIRTPLVPGGLQVTKNLEVWMEDAPDGLEVEDDALHDMQKFSKQSAALKRKWRLQNQIAKAESDVKMLEQRLDSQLRRNARRDQASHKANNSGNKSELELERLLGRAGGAGPPVATDKATLFSSWAEDGSNAAPSSLLSPRARGLLGSGSAEEKRVPLSFWDHMDGFASDIKSTFAPRPASSSSAPRPAVADSAKPDPLQSQLAFGDPLQALGRDLAAYLSSSPKVDPHPIAAIANGHAIVPRANGGPAPIANGHEGGGLAMESRPKAQAKSRADTLRKADAEDNRPEKSEFPWGRNQAAAKQGLQDQANGDDLATRLGMPAWKEDAEKDQALARSLGTPVTGTSLSLASGTSTLQLKFVGDRKKVNAGVFRTMLFSELRKLGVTSQTIDSLSFSLLPDDVITVHISGPADAISNLSKLGLSKLKVVGCSASEVKEL